MEEKKKDGGMSEMLEQIEQAFLKSIFSDSNKASRLEKKDAYLDWLLLKIVIAYMYECRNLEKHFSEFFKEFQKTGCISEELVIDAMRKGTGQKIENCFDAINTVMNSGMFAMEKNEETSKFELVRKMKYSPILQGNVTNKFIHSSSDRIISKKIDEVSGAGTVGNFEKQGMEITFKGYNLLKPNKMSPNTVKVFDFIVLESTDRIPYRGRAAGVKTLTESEAVKYREVGLSINRFMELTGIKDRIHATKVLKDGVELLSTVKMQLTEERTYIPEGKTKSVKEMFTWTLNFVSGYADSDPKKKKVIDGKVRILLEPKFIVYLSGSYIMPYMESILRINTQKYPNGVNIARKLLEHKNMNLEKDNENRIGVKTLVESLPDLPTVDEVKKPSRNIIDVFEKTMLALQYDYCILGSWRYCNANGVALTQKQIDKYNYDEWITWLIEFDLADYPPMEEERQRRRNEKQAALEKKKKGSQKKKAGSQKKKTGK